MIDPPRSPTAREVTGLHTESRRGLSDGEFERPTQTDGALSYFWSVVTLNRER